MGLVLCVLRISFERGLTVPQPPSRTPLCDPGFSGTVVVTLADVPIAWRGQDGWRAVFQDTPPSCAAGEVTLQKAAASPSSPGPLSRR